MFDISVNKTNLQLHDHLNIVLFFIYLQKTIHRIGLKHQAIPKKQTMNRKKDLIIVWRQVAEQAASNGDATAREHKPNDI
jgi:hypothetical protein